jgi:hypothetical protein
MSKAIGRGNRNVQEILDFHNRTKRFIGGLCKLEKDGSIRKLNGQIFSVKATKSGEALVLINNFLGTKRGTAKQRWQAILAKNLIQLNEHGWRHEKVA